MDHQVEIKIEAEDPSMPDVHVPSDTFIKQEGSNMFTDNPPDKSNLSGPTPVDVIFPVLVQGTETSCNVESLEGSQNAKNIRLLVLRDYRNFKDLSTGATIKNTPLEFDDFVQGKGESLNVPTATLKTVYTENKMKNEFQECGILPNVSLLCPYQPAPIEVESTKKKFRRAKSSNLGKAKPKRKTAQLGKPREQMADAKALQELELFAGRKGLQQIKPKPLSAPAPEPKPTYLRNSITCWTCRNMRNNQECNDWAPDLHCPTGESICQSVHNFYSESRESIRVEKHCVSPEKCSGETVGCTTDSSGIMTCISCCSTPYCNEHVAHDNHTAVRLSVTVIESSASNDISDWLFLLVIAMVIAAM